MTPDRHGRDSSGASGAAGMTVLVTGGTGFLGTSLARRLLADGARVRVLARSPARAEALAEMGADIVPGDINDQPAVCRAVDGVQVVYHLAGPLLMPGIPAEEYMRTHVTGTKLLLETFLKPALPEPQTWLDLGCGWGAVGCVLAKARPGRQSAAV